jgi:hypothetical protein
MSLVELTCSHVTESVTEFLEGALPEDQQLRFELHVVYCPGCTVFVDQIRSMVAGLERLPAAAPAEAERSAVVDAYVRTR